MSNLIIQADYDQLEQVAARLGQQSEQSAALLTAVRQCAERLIQEGWSGRGSAAFAAELGDELLPALQRMIAALDAGQGIVGEISALMRAAEEEAARLFQGSGGPLAAGRGATLAGATLLGATLAGATGGGRAAGAGGDGGGALAGWASPFASGAVLFGPGPVPIWGPGGRVPQGYNPAYVGKRLWLYIGGSGSDTIFSIHPHAGWGRAPKGLPKPNLRLDYGPINVKNGLAYLPNGQAIPVLPNRNFFHWNMQGGMGQVNRPLFRSLGDAVTHDHQLLSHAAPRSGVMGGIPGAKLVRGASKAFFLVGVGVDAYNIATAEDKPREVAKVAGGWAGAAVGAKGGAAIGATIGTFFGPGLGTAIGGGVGGFIGGVGGYFGGSWAGEQAYEAATN